MNDLKRSIIHILWIGYISVADGSCDYNFKGFHLNQTTVGPRPGSLELRDDFSNYYTPALFVAAKEIRQNFNLTLLAIPYKNNKSECPRTPISIKENIRQYNETCTFIKKSNEKPNIFFANIFTGCYYFIMTNEESNNTWQLGPVFANTSYNYHDVKLELVSSEKTKPEETNSRMQMITLLKIRLKCVKVKAELFQFEGEIDAADDIENDKIHASQKCWFRMGEKNVINECYGSKLITSLMLDVDVHEDKHDEWTAQITWKQLKKGGGTYYLRFTPYTKYCDSVYAAEKLYTWRAMNRSILIPLGYQNEVNLPKIKQTGTVPYTIIIISVCISLSIAPIAILSYWKWKCIKNFVSIHWAPSGEYEQLPKISAQQNTEEYNNILLMYVRDSPSFMIIKSQFRNALKETCNCRVYDLYGEDEFHEIRELGPIEWIEQLLRKDCKVVWLDTPEFRSRLNNEQERNDIKYDFRDDAIPHAVHLIKEIFQDSTTQYLYHFVVRVEGFEVDDDKNDPLLVVVPHARYYIPGHFSLLCKNLTETSNEMSKHTTKCEV